MHTAEPLILNGRDSSFTFADPADKHSRIARRVGSASAANVRLSVSLVTCKRPAVAISRRRCHTAAAGVMSGRSVRSAVLVAVAGCASRQPATTAVPPCFPLYPLASGARWTYDVDVVAGEGSGSTEQHVRVARVVGDASRAGPDWRFRIDSAPLPADTAVAAVERYRLAAGTLHDADDSLRDHEFLVPKPEQRAAWGGPRTFYPPGDGVWKVIDFFDLPPYHGCVKVHAQLEYGEITHVYCADVGPVTSEYHERAPRSHDDPTPGHHRDETWRLREFTPGTCAR